MLTPTLAPAVARAYAPGMDLGGSEDACDWRRAIFELASFARPSASEGERRAAQLIAERLAERGCEPLVEQESAHGGYWWPIGLANAIALAGAAASVRGRRAGRAMGALAAGAAAAALWDDLGHGRRWFRRMLPRRATWNVFAEAGDGDAARTVVLVAHHDAAHSGLVFHPALGRIGPKLFPRLHERSSQTVPILYGVWLGPVLICAAAILDGGPFARAARALRGAGVALAIGTIAAMADIGARPSVPGANDNLAAVGVLLALAERLLQTPLPGVRVLLLSTGSEESFSEGMQAFMRRHGAELPCESTEFVCLECLGGPRLIVLEGEGMLRMRDYTYALREDLAAAARSAGVRLSRGLRTVAATDALIALRAGYPAATLAAIDHTKLPLNYHWPNDVPEQLHWGTVSDALEVCENFLRERSAATSSSAGAPGSAASARGR